MSVWAGVAVAVALAVGIGLWGGQVRQQVRQWLHRPENLERWGRLRGGVQPLLSGLLDSWNAHHMSPHDIHLGDLASACNKARLERLGITHVVTAIIGVPQIFPDSFQYHLVPVRDVPDEDLLFHFDNATSFMHQAIQSGGKVFVHCMAGVSRSSSLVAAYLIRYKGMSHLEAVAWVKEKRPVVSPNHGFMLQLEHYSRRYNNRK